MNETEDRTMILYRELAKKAIAWVLADRICDDHAATANRVKREVDEHLRGKQPASERDRELLQKLEHEEIGLTLACQRETKCNEELRQMARRLVDELEVPRSVELPSTELERVVHVLLDFGCGDVLCALPLAGHKWTSINELREGITKIEDVSCEACKARARTLLTLDKTP